MHRATFHETSPLLVFSTVLSFSLGIFRTHSFPENVAPKHSGTFSIDPYETLHSGRNDYAGGNKTSEINQNSK